MADIDSLKEEYRSNLTQCMQRVKTELDSKATTDDLTELQEQVDAIETNLHTHDNKEVLDLLSESDTGKLQFNGVTIGGSSSETTYDTLETTDKTIVGAINEVNGNSLDTVGFSTDYKNIILNRKNGLNPYTIPISAIINNASLTELKDIDSTDIGNNKTLIYDAATQKHKYVGINGTDELVKMDSTGDAHYLADLLDKQTVINDNGILKVKKLDGQEVTITEINYLKGLTMNVMDLVNAFANGGVKVLNTPLNTASELDTMDRSVFIEGISYIVYVLADENHAGAKTTYLVDKNNTTFFGNADSQRNFTTNPIDLTNEVTGKLGTSNIDVDNLWALLTINDTYKTLTVTDNVFGTHGAKAMYDELTTAIGVKANASDIPTKTSELTNDSNYVTKEEIKNFKNVHVSPTTLGITIVNGQDNTRKVFDALGVGERYQDYWGNSSSTSKWGIAESYGNIVQIEIVKVGLGYGVCTAMTNKGITLQRYIDTSMTKMSDWKLATMDNTKDVGVTTITPVDSLITGTIEYTVKNGICYVSLFNVRSKNSGDNLSISTTMPKPAINSSSAITKLAGSGIIGIVNINKNTTQLTANINTSGILGSCSFSYPVAES